MMIKLLLIINSIIIISCVKILCVSHRKVDINHVLCFSLGYFYYCIVPYYCLEFSADFPGIIYNNMIYIYKEIPHTRIVYYLISILIIYLSFIIGSIRGEKNYKSISFPRVFHAKNLSFNYTQKIAFPLMVVLGLIILLLNRASLFHGYVYLFNNNAGYDSTRVLLSVYEFVIVVCVVYYLNSNPQLNLKKRLFNKWMVLLLVYSLLLLTTGGRLYVVTAFLSIVVFLSFSKSMNFKVALLLIYIVLFAFVMGLIGISRFGFVGFDFKSALFNILEEPLYTNYSNLTYLNNYTPLNIICVPVTLFSAILNFLPTKLFPWKINYITYITDLYPKIEYPVGATHFYPSYNAGFGLILSVLMFYCIGKWLRRIHKNYEYSNVTKRTMYCLVSANLVFTLFRDPIATSLIKNIIEFSIVLPWVVSAMNDLLYKVAMRK